MYLTGREIAGFFPYGVSTSQIQPAGIDLRVDTIEVLTEPGYLGREGKTIPRGKPLEPADNKWHLEPGAYRIRFLDAVKIPLNTVGFCYPRSSLLRMGAFLGCAVWDPGYEGRGEALLIVFNERGITIEKGSRIGQIVFARLEEPVEEGYSGSYQGEGL